MLLTALVACGGGKNDGGNTPNPPPTQPPPAPSPPPGVPQISGGEPLAWDQGAASAQEAQGFRYRLHVNDVAREFPNHTCASSGAAASFVCNARLPRDLPAGLVQLALSAVRERNGSSFESERSAVLQVWVMSGATAAGPGATLHVPDADEAAADPTTALVDLASLPDGRLLAADGAGRVSVIEGGRLTARAALDPSVTGAPPVASLAAAPDFDRSRVVFTAEAAQDRGVDVWDVVRYREIEGALGERAVVLPAAARRVSVRARLRVGPDALVYLAVSDGAPADGTAATVSLLRFTMDGRVPDGQASSVLRSGLPGSVALDWHPATGALWMGGVDDVAGAFVRTARSDGGTATLLVARADGTLERRIVSAALPSKVTARAPLPLGELARTTALVRVQDGAVIAAVSTTGQPPVLQAVAGR